MRSLRGEAWYREASRRQRKRPLTSDLQPDWVTEVEWPDVWKRPEPQRSREEQRRKDEDRIEFQTMERALPLFLQTLREVYRTLGSSNRMTSIWTDAVRIGDNLEALFEEFKRERDRREEQERSERELREGPQEG